MEEFQVSVLIPFYKAENYFDECMNSVLNQTHKPAEIIVVNDNSGGRAREYLKKFEAVAKVIHLDESHGVAGARNVLLKHASFDWIAFQDADDVWELTKLEEQVRFLEEHSDYVGCHTGVTTFNSSGALNQYTDKPSPLGIKDLMMGSHVTPPSLLINRGIVQELGGFDTNFVTSSDYEFSIRLVKAGNKIGFVAKPLIRVRRSDHGNISSNGFRTFRSHVKLVKKHKDLFVDTAGYSGIRKFLAKSLRESGGKIQGLKGKLVYYIGVVLR